MLPFPVLLSGALSRVSALLYEICRHIRGIADIPISLEGLDLTNENIANLPQTNCPISPHDVNTHGYAFGYHSDWFTKGTELIRSIANGYASEKGNVKSLSHFQQ